MAGRIAHYGGIVTNGLVLALDAAKKDSYPGSGTVWRDISGNGNNGTLTNGPTFNSGNGGSIVFDGVDDYGQLLSKLFQGVNDFTFSCVFKNTASTYSYYGGPIYTEHTSGVGTNNTAGFWIGEPDSSVSSSPFRLAFWYQVSNSLQKTYSTSTIVVNRTVDVSFVREGNQAKIYIDGTLDVSATRSTGPLDVRSNNPLIASVGYGARYLGSIYTMRCYNRALTAQEVLQNYNATKSRYL